MTCFPKEGVEYCKAITVDKKERHQGLYKQEEGVGKKSEKKKVSEHSFELRIFIACQYVYLCTCDRRRWNVTQ